MSKGLINKALSVKGIGNCIYPVGSIYMSTSPTSPADIWGGTWEQIKDKFLLAAGTTYAGGSTGGEATHTLTVNEMPSHTHTTDYYVSTGSGSTYAYTATANRARTQVTTNSTGGSKAHNNMPPYLSVYVWKRLTLAVFSGGGGRLNLTPLRWKAVAA